MKIIYLSQSFQPVTVNLPAPGDSYRDPVLGDCRRLTASRFCLAAERMGKDSDAFLGLLAAIVEASEKTNEHDQPISNGRTVESWYGMVGLDYGILRELMSTLRKTTCPQCKKTHWCVIDFAGYPKCATCWTSYFLVY